MKKQNNLGDDQQNALDGRNYCCNHGGENISSYDHSFRLKKSASNFS